jgi:hypothetical protein
MPGLPVLSGQRVVSMLERLGGAVARRRGRQIVMIRTRHIPTLSIPNHREVAKGTPPKYCAFRWTDPQPVTGRS